MRIASSIRLAGTLAVLAALLAACSDDDNITGTDGPKAFVRFVNAVPDTGTVDLRFVDRLENIPVFLQVAFRGTSGGYQRVEPGTRAVRIFPYATDPAATSQRLVDTTITLQANARYTLIYAGRARGNADRLVVLEEQLDLPTPGASEIAVKTVHAAVGTDAVDVRLLPAGSGASSTPAATFAGVQYLSRSDYTTVAARPTGTGNLYTFEVVPSGGAAALFSATPSVAGAVAPADATYGPTPGVQIGRSVLTAVVVPAAVAGSPAATATNITPNVVVLIDRPIDP